MQRMEGELAATIEKNLPRIGHIQIAGNPGRHEPDTGEIAYPFLFERLDALGYSGWVGAEYKPKGRTEDGLGWLRACGSGKRRQGMIEPRPFLTGLFRAAIDAASPAKTLARFLPAPPEGRTIVVGAGKAAASMAAALEAAWRGAARKAWSSPATAMARRRSASKSSKPRIPCQTPPGKRRRYAFSNA